MLEIIWSIYILRSRLNDFCTEIHFLLVSCEIQRNNCGEWLQGSFIDAIQGKDHFDFVWATTEPSVLFCASLESSLIRHVCLRRLAIAACWRGRAKTLFFFFFYFSLWMSCSGPVLVSFVLSSHIFTLPLGVNPYIDALTLTFKTKICH